MKFIKYFTSILLILSIVSCEDFLVESPKGALTPDGFFATANDLDLAVTAMYNSFQAINQQAGRVCLYRR